MLFRSRAKELLELHDELRSEAVELDLRLSVHRNEGWFAVEESGEELDLPGKEKSVDPSLPEKART